MATCFGLTRLVSFAFRTWYGSRYDPGSCSNVSAGTTAAPSAAVQDELQAVPKTDNGVVKQSTCVLCQPPARCHPSVAGDPLRPAQSARFVYMFLVIDSAMIPLSLQIPNRPEVSDGQLARQHARTCAPFVVAEACNRDNSARKMLGNARFEARELNGKRQSARRNENRSESNEYAIHALPVIE